MSYKPVGLLWDSVSNNIGDQAIGLVLKQFCETRNIPYQVLNPFSYDVNEYSTVIVGGGELLRKRGDIFYDSFRVPGSYILNTVGIHEMDYVSYLQNYRLLTVRSGADKAALASLGDRVQVRPCVSVLFEDYFGNENIENKYPENLIGVHINVATLRMKPELLHALEALDKKYKLLLIPFTLYQSDLRLMGTLEKWLDNATVMTDVDPISAFHTIGRLRMLISSSLHASIFAYIQNIPVLAFPLYPKIGYFFGERALKSSLYADGKELFDGVKRVLDAPPDYSYAIERDKELARLHLDEVEALVLDARKQGNDPIGSSNMQQLHCSKCNEAYHELLMQYLFAQGDDYASLLDMQKEKERLRFTIDQLQARSVFQTIKFSLSDYYRIFKIKVKKAENIFWGFLGRLYTLTLKKMSIKSLRFETLKGKCSINSRENDLAVIVHLFHKNLFEEIKTNLKNVEDFDLYISMPRSNEKILDDIFVTFPDAKVLFVENRGRDVYPFLLIYRLINTLNYTAILKIHSKKTTRRNDGDIWRRDIYDKLMGDPEIVKSIRVTLQDDPRVGIIAPDGHVLDYLKYRGGNQKRVTELASQIGVHLEKDDSFSFVAGTMFWAKPDALKMLLSLPIDIEDFAPEPLGPDGDLVHAIERLIGLLVKNENYLIYTVNQEGNIFVARNTFPYPFAVATK